MYIYINISAFQLKQGYQQYPAAKIFTSLVHNLPLNICNLIRPWVFLIFTITTE